MGAVQCQLLLKLFAIYVWDKFVYFTWWTLRKEDFSSLPFVFCLVCFSIANVECSLNDLFVSRWLMKIIVYHILIIWFIFDDIIRIGSFLIFTFCNDVTIHIRSIAANVVFVWKKRSQRMLAFHLSCWQTKICLLEAALWLNLLIYLRCNRQHQRKCYLSN